MQVTLVGQAGLLFETNGFRVLIDPYFSDAVEKINPNSFRRMPMKEKFWDVHPEVMVFTHNHLDHYDPETAEHFLRRESGMTVLAAPEVWKQVRTVGCGHNYVRFARHTQWTQGGVRFTAVKAEHSDPAPIGVILDDGEKKVYVTGDTLYNSEIFDDLPDGIDTVFLPVNGVGNNMNFADAARFAERVGAKRTVPIHIGMFDELTAAAFLCPNKWVLSVYKQYEL